MPETTMLRLMDMLAAAQAERDRYREALEHALMIVEDAAGMQCECDGYYTCNGCERKIADRANDAAEVITAALASDKEDSR